MTISNCANSDTFGTQLSILNQLVVAVNPLVLGNVLGANIVFLADSAFNQSNVAIAIANTANAAVNTALLTTGGTMTGNISFSSSNGALNGPTLAGYKEAVTNVGYSSSGSFTANLDLTNLFDVSLGAPNTTITITTHAPAGNLTSVTFIFRQPGATGNVINFANTFKWSYGEVPVLASGVAGTIDVVTALTVDGGITFLGTQSLANCH